MRLSINIYRNVSDNNLELGDLSGFAALDLVPLLGGPEPQEIVSGMMHGYLNNEGDRAKDHKEMPSILA